jgi:hypothetical protein
MSSGASRHHSPVAACQRLHVGQPVSRSPQWSISTKGWSHCLQRLDGMVTIHFDASAIWACPIHLTDLHLPQDQLQHSHVLARADHTFLASGLFAVCAIRTQSSACWRHSLGSTGMRVVSPLQKKPRPRWIHLTGASQPKARRKR